MLLVAVLFFPWTHERETISGFLGRMYYANDKLWLAPIVRFVDWLHYYEHCLETWLDEEHIRRDWYWKHYE
jgi:hypothetical protein